MCSQGDDPVRLDFPVIDTDQHPRQRRSIDPLLTGAYLPSTLRHTYSIGFILAGHPVIGIIDMPKSDRTGVGH